MALLVAVLICSIKDTEAFRSVSSVIRPVFPGSTSTSSDGSRAAVSGVYIFDKQSFSSIDRYRNGRCSMSMRVNDAYSNGVARKSQGKGFFRSNCAKVSFVVHFTVVRGLLIYLHVLINAMLPLHFPAETKVLTQLSSKK